MLLDDSVVKSPKGSRRKDRSIGELGFRRFGWSKRARSGRARSMAALLLIFFGLFGCRKSPEPVTITFLDPEGLLDLGDRRMISDEYLREFTRQTGIRVNHLPTPQNNGAQLQLVTQLLQSGASTPDVYGVDTIWAGDLGEYLVDLRPYLASEMPIVDPEVLASYVVQGKLVAMPYHPNVGVLYYRTDLLRKYGYSAPPRTWDELEKMALRIQAGERARGKKDFWGFLWPGNGSLTSQGMEWLVGEGGGRIIEADRTISINNPNAIHAWERAAHWVGWISSPGALSYSDWDVSNAFWISGNTAFARGWADYFQRHPPGVSFRQEAGVTSVPGGKSGRVSTLGGYALAVSRSSAHRSEAIKLVEFLTKSEAQLASSHSEPRWQLQFYEVPAMLARRFASSEKAGQMPGGSIVSRPSTAAGPKYDAVSLAYEVAVRSVLTGQSTASAAAAGLEKELVHITGFEVSRPVVPADAAAGPDPAPAR
jgi:trehalose/maltose transport system substrate-binding protein